MRGAQGLHRALARTALVAPLVCCGSEAPRPVGSAGAQHEHAAHELDAAHAQAAAPPADRSIYQLDGSWTAAGGGDFRLAQLRGHPVLVLLFYGTCQHACPILVHDLARVDAALAPEERAAVRYLLVSFDPERDTPERLFAYASEHALDPSRWTLLHGEPGQVRELALVLGVRYRPTGNGEFSHTSRITLLDREGAVRAHADGLGQAEPSLLGPLRELLHGASPSAAAP